MSGQRRQSTGSRTRTVRTSKKLWEQEWQRNLFDAAIARVKKKVDPKQFQIFDCYVRKEWPAQKVAQQLGVNVGQVYLARHRISALLEKRDQETGEARGRSKGSAGMLPALPGMLPGSLLFLLICPRHGAGKIELIFVASLLRRTLAIAHKTRRRLPGNMPAPPRNCLICRRCVKSRYRRSSETRRAGAVWRRPRSPLFPIMKYCG